MRAAKVSTILAAILGIIAALFAQETTSRPKILGVAHMPDSWTAQAMGKFISATRVSDHIMHVGVLCGDLDKSIAFSGGVLGFKEFWRGSSSPNMLSWVDIRPAEGLYQAPVPHSGQRK